jgi:hypothetical protein
MNGGVLFLFWRSMLMVAAGTTVDKSILVPFVVLQAPSGVTFLVK